MWADDIGRNRGSNLRIRDLLECMRMRLGRLARMSTSYVELGSACIGARRVTLLASLLAFGVHAAPVGQGVTGAPPLRSGLWQQDHQQTLNGEDFQVPEFLLDQARQAGVQVNGNGSSERLCVTPQNIASIGAPGNDQLPACRKEDVRLTSKGLSLKLVCADETGSGSGTVDVVFDNATHYHGRFTFNGTHQLFGDNMLPLQLAGTVSGHWLAPACPAGS